MKKTEESFVFIDQNDNPILIEDLEEFYQEALNKYKIAIIQYHESCQKLTEARDIRTALDWDYDK